MTGVALREMSQADLEALFHKLYQQKLYQANHFLDPSSLSSYERSYLATEYHSGGSPLDADYQAVCDELHRRKVNKS